MRGRVGSSSEFTNFDDPAANPGRTFAYAINNSGQIAGSYYDSVGQHAFVATPNAVSVAPEPSSVASVGIVALFAGGLMFKARKRQAV